MFRKLLENFHFPWYHIPEEKPVPLAEWTIHMVLALLYGAEIISKKEFEKATKLLQSIPGETKLTDVSEYFISKGK